MRPEARPLLAVVAAFVMVVSVAGAFVVLLGASGPTLPIPAGTAFTGNETLPWASHFTVGASGGVLGGAWTAYGVRGGVDLVLVNGTVAKPWPPPGPPPECPAMPFWPVYNGTLDRVLSPGPYTVYWDTGDCGVPTEILVTQTVQVLPA